MVLKGWDLLLDLSSNPSSATSSCYNSPPSPQHPPHRGPVLMKRDRGVWWGSSQPAVATVSTVIFTVLHVGGRVTETFFFGGVISLKTTAKTG